MAPASGEDDLRAARLLQNGDQAAQACFLAQQVGGKALKALLAADDRDLRSPHSPPGYGNWVAISPSVGNARPAYSTSSTPRPVIRMPWAMSFPPMCSARKMARRLSRPLLNCCAGQERSCIESTPAIGRPAQGHAVALAVDRLPGAADHG